MESSLVLALNSFFSEHKIYAESYRLYQSKYGFGQNIDLVCDSLDRIYYLGIECKSCDFSKGQGTLNFKSRFSDGQIEKEHRFCLKTGRKGFVAVEIRLGAGKPKKMYFVPLKEIYDAWSKGKKSLKLKEIMLYPYLKREKGKYIITESFFKELEEV
jgi:hypothetical protein